MTLPDQHLTDPTDFVRAHWHSDGPHTSESIASAATAIEELMRYLAHATRLDLDVPTLYAMTGSLAHATQISEQVLTQLASSTAALADRDDLRSDDINIAPATAALTAAGALDGDRDVRALRQRLDIAQQQLGHLYVAGDDE